MTTRQYIGARYIPIFANPVQWSDDREYDYLTMVQYQGETYMSKQYVPTDIPLPDTSQGEEDNEYWVHMSNWNAQVEVYREEVLQYNDRISTVENDLPLTAFDSTNTVDARFDAIEDLLPSTAFDSTNTVDARFDATDNKISIRPIIFNTVSDMKISNYLTNGCICKTCGFNSVNDGGDAWYIISTTGTANEMDVIQCGDFIATLLYDDEMKISQFGGIENDDVSAAIQRMLNLGINVNGENKTYTIETQITPVNITKIKNCKFNLSSVNGFFAREYYIDEYEIINCEFFNSLTRVSSGFSLDAALAVIAKTININNCSFYNNKGNGCILYEIDNVIDSNVFKNVTIENCIAYNNGETGVSTGVGIGAYGNLINYETHIIIENCIAYDNENSGIAPHGLNNIVITNCISHDNNEHGFVLQDSTNSEISNCVSYDNNNSPIRIQGNYIEANGYCKKVLICNNNLKGNHIAIGYGCEDIVITNNLYEHDGRCIIFDHLEKSCHDIIFTNNYINGQTNVGKGIVDYNPEVYNFVTENNYVNGILDNFGGYLLDSTVKRLMASYTPKSLNGYSIELKDNMQTVSGSYTANTLVATGSGLAIQADAIDIPSNNSFMAIYMKGNAINVTNGYPWVQFRLRDSGGTLINDSIAQHTTLQALTKSGKFETCVLINISSLKSSYPTAGKIQLAIYTSGACTIEFESIQVSTNGYFNAVD